MNEKQTMPAQLIRPTKKQRELLTFITQFISEHGYSPSYREIMSGLNYTSVATVALHVNSLIKRGHLRKREYSARSIELADPNGAATVTSNQIAPAEEKWLVEKVTHAFSQADQVGEAVTDDELNRLYILVAALKVLGLETAASSFEPRLAALKKWQAKGAPPH